MLLLEVLLAWGVILGGVFAADWSYSGKNGPANWTRVASNCGLNQQSPINIYEGDIKDKTITEQFVYNNYNTAFGVDMTLSNNGHTVKVALGGTTPITVFGGGLPAGTFRALQFHFHWGSDSSTGSEHLISSQAYPMEVHIVHFNTRYNDVEEALKHKDGLAVLGFMYEVSSVTNIKYNEIVNNLANLPSSGGVSVKIQSVPLEDLLPETYLDFYRYSGSLTTPICQEVVMWTVFKDPIKISEQQLAKFRTLLDSHNHSLVNNYRPIQPLNSRTVQTNFKIDIHWTYSDGHIDADHWDHYYSNCGGDRQSPIDIQSADSKLDTRMSIFHFHNYSSTTGISLRARNNGHTANVDIDGEIGISGGSLQETYKAAQFHLHWGSSDMKGSEHTIDGHAYPMEMHIVHFMKSMQTLYKAAVLPRGLAVLGFFFEISPADNPALKPIIESLAAIRTPNSSVSIPTFALDSILPKNKDDFYRYEGSLTTPRCYQTVIWTVFKDTIKISPSQLNAFRGIKSSEKDSSGNTILMVDNFRPVQKLNNRSVVRNFVVIRKSKWSYHGEHGHTHWSKDYPMCTNTPTSRQSPINIQQTKVLYTKFDQLKLSNYNEADDVEMEMKNNGHTVAISIDGGDIEISGGGLEGTYRAAQLHFHWGADSRRGSEHLIDNRAYPMEIHIIHYNTIFPNALAASAHRKGLAVLGFMYEITKEDNPNYKKIIEKLSAVKQPYTKTEIQAFPLASILPSDMKNFYRYHGSLTTPACNESITWTVFTSPIKISESQIATFRSLLSSDINPRTSKNEPLVDNYRPPQNTNNRLVHANFLPDLSDTSPTLTTNLILTSILLLLLRLI